MSIQTFDEWPVFLTTQDLANMLQLPSVIDLSTGEILSTHTIDPDRSYRTLWTYGKSTGGIQIWNGSRSRASTFRPRHHTPNPKCLTAVEHRQLDP
jgi:hypothetical protein